LRSSVNLPAPARAPIALALRAIRPYSAATWPPAASIAALAPAVASTPWSTNFLVISPSFTTLARFAVAGTSLAARSAAKSMVPASSLSSWYSSTSAVSAFFSEAKPIFGRRRCMGIWPPSKPALILPLPERANEPLWPRPAVLPRPEPMPRPTRLRSVRAPSAGLSVLSFMRLLLDPGQVVDLVDQAPHLRAVLQFAHAVQLAQAQGLHGQAMDGLGSPQALDQAHLDGAGLFLLLSHAAAPPPSCRAWPRSGSANACR